MYKRQLLIVIVILGILAGIVVFAVQNLTSSSAQSACSADQKTVQIAVEAFKAQVSHYPSVGDNAAATPGGASAAAVAATPGVQDLYAAQTVGGNTVGPWLKSIPANSGHYSITVTQDGAGTIGVLNGAGAASTCSAVG